MTSESIAWLYALQRGGIKLGLDGIRGLLRILGHPERAYPTILVGGTNGKGSVSAMLDAILGAAGLTPGLYSSPHLVHPGERIRVAGRDAVGPGLDALLERVREACERGLATGALEAHPSFFEVMTAAACLSFADARVDAAILEVGLGGRLDATNAADPCVSVIVTVDVDHVAQLGPTLASIAGEKAGIARAGRPLVSGVTQPEAASVIRERCREVGATLVEAAREASIERGPGQGFAVVTPKGRYDRLVLPLPGDHQRENARVALVALERLGDALGRSFDAATVRRGLAATRWRGRLQWIEGDPPILLDGAHNAAGASALAAYLDARGGHPPVLVFAAMKDKDLEGILAPLARRAAAVVVTRPGVERAGDPADLAVAASRDCTRVETAADAAAALDAARRLAAGIGGGTFVLVAGSLYLVGEVLSVLEGAAGPGPVAL